jgi:hypothetical protein
VTRAWESTKAPLPPLYISRAMYQACRKARPDIAWDTFSPADIQVRGGSVMIVEDTPAAEAIREAMMATRPEDFGP